MLRYLQKVSHHKYLKEVARRRRKIVPKQIHAASVVSCSLHLVPGQRYVQRSCKRMRKHRVPKLLPLPIENVRDVNETDIANSEYAKETPGVQSSWWQSHNIHCRDCRACS
jgi:hypothetical protein